MKKLFEEGTISGNGTGQGGGASLPFNKGYFQSGNSGEPGITFTPTGERRSKKYKEEISSRKKMKERQKKKALMKKFKEFNEDATATLGNSGGMGGVVAANPSSTPGNVAGSSIGSGDVGQTLGTYTKPGVKMKKKKKNKREKIKSFENFK